MEHIKTKNNCPMIAVKNAKMGVGQNHAQSAKNSLRDDAQKRGDAKPAHPFARIFEPEPDGKNRGQKSDGGREQPVRVFKKCAAHSRILSDSANIL